MLHSYARPPLSTGLRLLVGVMLVIAATGQANYPIMPDCTSLQPAPCGVSPFTNPDGSINFTAGYLETCTSHACAVPQPSSVAYSWTNPSNAGAGPIAVTPWFCPDYISLDYPARVATGTGLPPGKAEDLWAQCNYAGLQFNLLLDDCRDVRLWTCDDCRAAYQRWVCAASFRRCNGTDPNVVMPNCDDICWATVRQCPATQQFSCPNNGESGDYVPGSGMPTCNDPRLTAGRTLVPGGIVVASLGDGGIPVVTKPPAPLPEAPPISEGPAMAPGPQAGSEGNGSSIPASVPVPAAVTGPTAGSGRNGPAMAPAPAPGQLTGPPGAMQTAPPSPVGSAGALNGSTSAAQAVPPPPVQATAPLDILASPPPPPPPQPPAPEYLGHDGTFTSTPSTEDQVATVQAVQAQQRALQAAQAGTPAAAPALSPPPGFSSLAAAPRQISGSSGTGDGY